MWVVAPFAEVAARPSADEKGLIMLRFSPVNLTVMPICGGGKTDSPEKNRLKALLFPHIAVLDLVDYHNELCKIRYQPFLHDFKDYFRANSFRMRSYKFIYDDKGLFIC